jgi:predicted DNA binding CopG/RHH family protein
MKEKMTTLQTEEKEKEQQGAENLSLDEALGRTKSELLSTQVGKTLKISKFEFEKIRDQAGQEVEQALIYASGFEKPFRTSAKAVLNKLHKIDQVGALTEGKLLTVKVIERKSQGSRFTYISLE